MLHQERDRSVRIVLEFGHVTSREPGGGAPRVTAFTRLADGGLHHGAKAGYELGAAELIEKVHLNVNPGYPCHPEAVLAEPNHAELGYTLAKVFHRRFPCVITVYWRPELGPSRDPNRA
jgi:hypothetical protein